MVEMLSAGSSLVLQQYMPCLTWYPRNTRATDLSHKTNPALPSHMLSLPMQPNTLMSSLPCPLLHVVAVVVAVVVITNVVGWF